MVDEQALLLAISTHSPYIHQLFYHLFKDDPSVLHNAHKEMMASVCQKCGDPGYRELLVHCRKCKISAEHRYCLDKFPKPHERVRWFCEQCEPSSTLVSLGKLVIGNERSNDDLKCDDQQKYYSDIPRPKDKRRETSSHGETVLPKFPRPRDKKGVTSSCHKVVPLRKMQNDETSDSKHKKIEGEISPRTFPEKGEGRKLKRRRRLLLLEDPSDHELLTDCGDWNANNKPAELPSGPVSALLPSDRELLTDCGDRNVSDKPTELPSGPVSALPPSGTISCSDVVQEKVHDDQPNVQWNQAPSSQHLLSALPVFNPVWRGCIYFGDEKYGPLTAHASIMACERVYNAAKLLPPILLMEKLPRLQFCPNSLKDAPPTDDKIGLYFFPGGTMVGCVLDQLLDQLLEDAIHKDLLFRFICDEAELLVFSSTVLHQDHQRFKGKYYLWGAFRGRQASVSSPSANCLSMPSELRLESRGTEVSYEHAGEKEEGEDRDDKSSEAAFSPLSVLQLPTRSNELREETPRSADLSKLADDKGGVGAHDENHEDYELEEGEIYERYVESEKGDDLEEYVEGEDGENREDSKDCLQFLPLASEYMGIVSKYGSGDELNLELGLGLSQRKFGNGSRGQAVLNSFL